MSPRISFSVLAIALFLVGTSAQDHPEEELNSISFGYSGTNGPEKWGSLSPLFNECSSGKTQSPVDIVKDKVVRNKNLKPLSIDYSPANSTLVNNGFNVGMRYEGDVGVLIADGKNFSLKQVHWHSPSEHRINGEQYPTELHMVHQAADGSFSVVSILYKYGDADPLLTKGMKRLISLSRTLETRHIKRKARKYYRYVGSLTTPPCTENVLWNILGKVRSISKEQVEALQAPLYSTCKKNARPAQPLNGRQIELYDELGDHE
uniref:Carbonic anhydrase n=1 Tax=Fagus sylvatica TaxID=28930 RepID=A0A2N9HW99_FAGSY